MENTFIENKKKYVGVLGAFGLSVGTSIGWGSFVVTGSNYLSKAGLIGSIIGIILGTILMCVIAFNYHYMINKVPDSGGIYSFVKHTFNGDHAFLASWFLIIVYTSILWANVTSVALFSRFLFGGVFQFGRLYSIAGYDVYIGEVLLCAGALFLIGGLTFLNKKISTNLVFGLVMIFVAAIIFVSLFSIIKQNGQSIGDITFAPTEENHFGQIVAVLAMSPWAFIGFENISHSTGSFLFKTKKVLYILIISLIVSALVYILLCQISVMAHPDNYSSWYDYIANNKEEGIMGIPPFYVAKYYLGGAGVAIFGVALFAIIATSIMGNIFALSNLIQRMAEDGIFPKAFAYVNKNDIPVYVRVFIIGLTFFAIFIGRSAIGFIVDVNNIGGVIVYAYVSACAFVNGYRKRDAIGETFGIIGFVASLIFGIAHIAPVFLAGASIAQETFIVFVAFALLGFGFFIFTLYKDKKGNFGNSSIVWVGLSILVAFFSGVWIIERSKGVHEGMLGKIKEYYDSLGGAEANDAELENIAHQADRQNIIGNVVLFIIISLTLMLLFITLHLVKNNAVRRKKQLDTMSDIANKDPLTAVNNHRAFVNNERRLTTTMHEDPNYKYGIVVCDVNDLKYVNDKFGHDYGDEYLRKACQMICRVYKMSPVFRIGGDEFAVILEGEDFENRTKLQDELAKKSLDNANSETGIVIAVGTAINRENESLTEVFRHADKLMYMHKSALKTKRPSHYLR